MQTCWIKRKVNMSEDISEHQAQLDKNYEICKLRGHESKEGMTQGDVTWNICMWCRRWYRYENVLIELPPKNMKVKNE